MPYKDIAKRREAQKRYYKKNLEKYKIKNAKRKKMLLDFVNSLKDISCMDCNNNYPHYVMDFDHKDGNLKVSSIARMVRDGKSKIKITEEMKKCDLICANCHRIRTYKRLKNNY